VIALRIIALGAIVVLSPVAARASQPLDVDLARDGTVALASGGLAIGLALYANRLTPSACRFCEPDGFDLYLRTRLRWSHPDRAALASDVLANGVLPAAVIAHAVVVSWLDDSPRQAGEDLLAITEAVLLATDVNELVKGATGRLRPAQWAADQRTGLEANRSFYSGHASLAFSLASAAGTVSTLRGYRSAPWVWAVGMTLAAGVGYLRVAGDAHWVTDVLAGAAIGGAIGWGVPWMLNRPSGGRPPAVQLVPAPGGFALLF
jgi:membrane-associated phospholipid phosphatase